MDAVQVTSKKPVNAGMEDESSQVETLSLLQLQGQVQDLQHKLEQVGVCVCVPESVHTVCVCVHACESVHCVCVCVPESVHTVCVCACLHESVHTSECVCVYE